MLKSHMRPACRGITRRPGFAAVAVLTLAVGVAASTAAFSVVEAVLLRDLPFPESDRIVRVWERNSQRSVDRNAISAATFLDWRARSTSFERIGAFNAGFGLTLTEHGDPERLEAASVTADTLEVLRVQPLLGRVFSDDGPLEGEAGAVLLSEELWRTRFGGDATIVGRAIALEGTPAHVVGVMPASFDFPGAEVLLWVPVRVSAEQHRNRKSHMLGAVGRLAPGRSAREAQAELDAISITLEREDPEFMRGWRSTVVPLREAMVGGVRAQLLTVLAATGLLLLVACANVAGLLLARGHHRRRELALRLALGARPRALVVQAVIESTLLAAVAAVIGVALAQAAVKAALALAPPGVVPRLEGVGVNPAVLAWAAGLALTTGVLGGLAPGLAGARSGIADVLRGGRGSAELGGQRARSALVVAEVAVSLVLLVLGGLLVRSLLEITGTQPGFATDRRVVAYVYLPAARYAGIDAHTRFFASLVETIGATPGVLGAAATTDLAIAGSNVTRSCIVEGQDRFDPGHPVSYPFRAVTPGYFAVMDVPLLRGRDFTEADRADAPPVLVVNASLARAVWAGSEAVGRRVSFSGPEGPWWTVIGVAGDERSAGLDKAAPPAFYLPHAQRTWRWHSWAHVVVYCAGDPATVMPAVKAAVRRLDPALPVHTLTTMERVVEGSVASRRFVMLLMTVFAAVAAALAAVGLYAALAHSVAQRTRELGVRLAVGADPRRLVTLVLRQGWSMALIGGALGLAIAQGAARLVGSQLHAIQPWDPLTALLASGLVALVATLASAVPARRASAVDPMQALRYE